MGLRQVGENFDRVAFWWVPALIAIASVLLEFGGDTVRELLRYDRTLIGEGSIYRLLTAHMVHVGWQHLLLNLAGLVLVWLLVGSALSSLQWLVVCAAAAIAIDLGFWLLMPELGWYVGLSGVLHGLLAAGVVGLFGRQAGPRGEACALGVVLLLKLGYEALVGPLPGSESTAGAIVVTEAHLLGAIGGALAGLTMRLRASI